MGRDALSGLRVVEVAGRYSARVAGHLLAALGAGVTRIVTDSELDEYPLVAPDGPASRVVLDGDKRIVSGGPGVLASFIGEADVLITSGENTREEDPAAMRRQGLPFRGIHVDVSPYGLTGPCRDWKATDLTIGAHAALAAYVGEPDGAPLVPPVQLISYQAGLAAAVGALAGQPGTVVEVAEFDVIATTHIAGLYSLAFFSGAIPRRAGRRKPAPYPFTHLPCADGWVCLTIVEGRHWARFVDAMGNPEWTTEERYRDRRIMGERYPEEVDALVAAWLATKTKAEILEIALERGLPIAPLRTLDELLSSGQLAARGFLREVVVDGGFVRVPGLPFRLNPSSQGDGESVPKSIPGLRALDLGRVLSAPAVGQWFADLGADVIKVESRTHLDSARKGRPLLIEDVEAADAGQTPNLMPYFLALNRGKRSLTLDLGNPAGRGVLLRLVPQADVLIENFGSGGLERFGLCPDRLREINPALVVVRISAVGQKGPEATLPGYAPQSTSAAGLDALCGYPESDPVGMIGINFGDINAAAFASLAVLAALRQGRGCTVDLSMLEANATHLGPVLAAYQLDRHPVGPAGHTHRAYHPHGIYPSADPGEWVAVAARTPAERAALAAVVGDTGEEAVMRWAKSRPSRDAAAALQANGVPAAPVLGVEDLLFDEHTRARGDVFEVPHTVLGIVPVPGVPFRAASDLMAVRGRAPDLAEHTVEVLREAGYDTAEIEALAAAGALDTDGDPNRMLLESNRLQ